MHSTVFLLNSCLCGTLTERCRGRWNVGLASYGHNKEPLSVDLKYDGCWCSLPTLCFAFLSHESNSVRNWKILQMLCSEKQHSPNWSATTLLFFEERFCDLAVLKWPWRMIVRGVCVASRCVPPPLPVEIFGFLRLLLLYFLLPDKNFPAVNEKRIAF